MGSRIGSLIVLLALGGIVAVAVILVLRFSGDSETQQPAVFVSLAEDQPVLLGQPLEIEVRAQGGNPISILTLLIDGQIITQATPIFDPDQGRYSATLFWTPTTLGFAALRIIATDTTGAQTEVARRLDVTDDADRVARARQAARSSQPEQSATVQPPPTTGAEETEADSDQGAAAPEAQTPSIGAARILNIQDGARYDLASDQPLEVQIEATSAVTLESILFYVTPIRVDGSFGESRLVFSAIPNTAPGGVYRGIVPDLQDWLPEPGTYELQLVALPPESTPGRLDDVVRITVIHTEEDGEEEDGAQEQSGDQDEADDQPQQLADLAIVTVRENEGGIAVTVINTSANTAELVEVDLSVVRVRDASVLASTRARLTLAPDQRASIPLEISVAEVTETLVVLESGADADTTNNTFELTLSATESGPAEDEIGEEQDTADELGDAAQEEAQDGDQAEEPEPPPAAMADLDFLETRFTDDGYALLTIINRGNAPSGEFAIRIADAAGGVLEIITRGLGGPLAPLDTEILAGSVPHSGSVVITIDPDDTTRESDESNNVLSLEVGG